MFTRLFSVLALTVITLSDLVAQADAAPVESPQRGATHVNKTGVWYEEPFVWIGALIVLLIAVLLVLRRKNAPTVGLRPRREK